MLLLNIVSLTNMIHQLLTVLEILTFQHFFHKHDVQESQVTFIYKVQKSTKDLDFNNFCRPPIPEASNQFSRFPVSIFSFEEKEV